MICLEWRQEFLVGDEVVDAQHRQLFEMLASLRAAIEQCAGNSELEAIVDGLVVYLKGHFSCEEDLLRTHPQWDEHHRQHWHFTEKVLYFLREIKRSATRIDNGLACEMYDFLCDWLQKHIVGVDRRYFREKDSLG